MTPEELRSLGPAFTCSSTQVTVATTRTSLLSADPTRVYLAFIQNSGQTAFFDIIAAVNLNQGWAITSSTPIEFYFSKHGGLVQQAWYGISAAAQSTFTCIQVFYRPYSSI